MLSLGDWKLGTTAFTLTLSKTEWLWVLGTSGSRDLSCLVLNEVTLPQTDIVCILDILLNSRLLFKEGLYAVLCWVPFVTITWIMTHCSVTHSLIISQILLSCALHKVAFKVCFQVQFNVLMTYKDLYGKGPGYLRDCTSNYIYLSHWIWRRGMLRVLSTFIWQEETIFYLGIHPLKCHSPEFRLPLYSIGLFESPKDMAVLPCLRVWW